MSEVKLYLGDCLEVMKSIPDKSVDAVITDLPYGSTRCTWDVVIPFEAMWKETWRIIKQQGYFITTASQLFTSQLITSNIKNFKYELIWNKCLGANYLNANFQPIKTHENILVFSESPTTFAKDKMSATYNPKMTVGRHRKAEKTDAPQFIRGNRQNDYKYFGKGGNKRFPKSIIEISNANHADVNHVVNKPTALYKYLIETYTNNGECVLDLAMGSGTTGVACVQTGRNFIGIEIDPKYYAIAEKRIKDAQQQMRLPL